MNKIERRIFNEDFERALQFATRLHAAQSRKGTQIPYISHLIAVASLVLEHGGDRDQAIAGLLHDSIEDQADEYPGGVHALRKMISSEFGERVLEIVEACTDADTVPKPPWRDRKEQYLRHLESVPSYVLLVSCADKLHNARAIVSDLRSLGDELFGRFTAGKEGTLWYYRSLANTFVRIGPKALAVELDLAVKEMERMAGAP
jgi:(p)ppGpp synthase/HD superfamily hydrolase